MKTGRTELWTGAVTLHDVATAAGVHPSTVSRALDPARQTMVREMTRRRIAEIASELGYRPHMGARSLQSGRTATVGVITADLGNTFVTPIIHGIAASIESSGFLPMIAETQDDRSRFAAIIDHMMARRVDAMIVISAQDGDQTMLDRVGRSIPVIIAARPLPGSTLPQAIHDDEGGGVIVATHLADLGHRRVVQLPGPKAVANFPRRSEGFSREAASRRMSEIDLGEWASSPTIEEGERLMELALDESPTAVFAGNDWMALGALAVCRRHRLRVPDDISVVGYNDLAAIQHMMPALTTVRYPSLEIGQLAGTMALARMEGHQVDDVVLSPTLIERASTAPCPTALARTVGR